MTSTLIGAGHLITQAPRRLLWHVSDEHHADTKKAQGSIRSPELKHLPVLRAGAGSAAGIDLGLLHSIPQRLRINPKLLGDPGQRPVLLARPLLRLEHHSHGPIKQLVGVLLRCWHWHTLPRLRTSFNSGAVQQAGATWAKLVEKAGDDMPTAPLWLPLATHLPTWPPAGGRTAASAQQTRTLLHRRSRPGQGCRARVGSRDSCPPTTPPGPPASDPPPGRYYGRKACRASAAVRGLTLLVAAGRAVCVGQALLSLGVGADADDHGGPAVVLTHSPRDTARPRAGLALRSLHRAERTGSCRHAGGGLRQKGRPGGRPAGSTRPPPPRSWRSLRTRAADGPLPRLLPGTGPPGLDGW